MHVFKNAVTQEKQHFTADEDKGSSLEQATAHAKRVAGKGAKFEKQDSGQTLVRGTDGEVAGFIYAA